MYHKSSSWETLFRKCCYIQEVYTYVWGYKIHLKHTHLTFLRFFRFASSAMHLMPLILLLRSCIQVCDGWQWKRNLGLIYCTCHRRLQASIFIMFFFNSNRRFLTSIVQPQSSYAQLLHQKRNQSATWTPCSDWVRDQHTKDFLLVSAKLYHWDQRLSTTASRDACDSHTPFFISGVSQWNLTFRVTDFVLQ